MQLKLLRALETRQFERIGGIITIPLKARIIATTSRDLNIEVKEGRFREDLFFRINVININLPPLNIRMEDLPIHINYILENLSNTFNRETKNISSSAFKILKNHNWPGNIRELENVLEHAYIISNGGSIEPEHLPERLWSLLNKPSTKKDDDEEITLKSAEKLILIKNLRKFKGHRGKTAKALGIDRTSLWRKMKKYNLLN
jgi:transcriptional regulator with PAS, ATPase and Fis domain